MVKQNRGLAKSKFRVSRNFGISVLANIPYIESDTDMSVYYVADSKILKNTQWDIFHIFTSESTLSIT